MGLKRLDIIDVISLDPKGNVVLTIVDDTNWRDPNAHMLALQKKINEYLRCIENGSLVDSYPDAENRHVVINIMASHNPDEAGISFIENVKRILNSAGYSFEFKILQE